MEPTHIVFDGKNLVFSTNLAVIPNFLIEIEKEVQSFLNREEQLEKIQKQLVEFGGMTQEMARVIRDSNLDFHFQISEPLETIADKLEFHRSPRSEFIVLFAYLETLRCLWSAYKLNTNDKIKLQNASNDEIDSFLTDFCLCKKNKWVKNNSKKAGKIGVKNLRKLRNSLTHFFSVSTLGIAPSTFDKNLEEKITNATNNKAQFIRSNDLFEILSGTFEILIQRWCDDFQKSLNDPNSDFEQRILCVKKLVEENGAVLLHKNNFNFQK